MRKKLIIADFLVLFIVFGTSCKKELLPTYSAANSVYFDNYIPEFDGYSDSTVITFAFARTSVSDSLLKLRINVTGSPSEQVRPFVVEVDPSSTASEGIHYEALPASFDMPPGQVFDTITIRLLRSDDLKQNTVRLVLKVKSNEHFSTNISGANTESGLPVSTLQHSVILNDILVQPPYWNGTSYGKFSGKKMELMCSLGQIEPSFFVNGDPQTPTGTVEFTIKLGYMGELLKQYLLQQKNAGTPVYYEDGITEMTTDDYY